MKGIPVPTKLPRLNVTITEHQAELLRELGELQGKSSASYLRDMLDQATPMLETILPVWRAAAAKVAMQPQELQRAIRDALETVDAQKAQLSLLEHVAAVQPRLANDPGGAAAGPSGAREDGGSVRRKRRNRA